MIAEGIWSKRKFDRRDSMFQWRCDDRIETKRIRWFGSNETNSNLCGYGFAMMKNMPNL